MIPNQNHHPKPSYEADLVLQHPYLQEIAWRIHEDTYNLPRLGVLAVEGVDILGDGEFKGIVYLGLEPTSGIGDELNTCKEANTLKELPADRELELWISVSLRTV